MQTQIGKKALTSSYSDFLNGLVFGFDVGTGSIGYAVRKGAEFLDVGVLICPEGTNDLADRRTLRRQRRTLRSRKYRRQWFATELGKLGLPKPLNPPNDPIALRLRALNGEELAPEDLHAALTHLFKRRGYSKVPWANVERATTATAKPKKDDEEGVIKEAVKEITKELAGRHPCQLLAEKRAAAGKSPSDHWARKIPWPREALRDEFLAIVEAQAKRFPKLAEKADWLLYGDSQPKKKGEETYHVFFTATEARNPGVLGLRWPRFDNRGPALDSLQPVDEQGRPQHVVRKDKDAFTKAQWELAVLNFRVVDKVSGASVQPDTTALARLKEIWLSSLSPAKRKAFLAGEDIGLEISIKGGKRKKAPLELGRRSSQNSNKLVEGQQPLTPQTGAGRARYSSPTLERIISGERFDSPQPLLRRDGETADEALNRYLAGIKHPLVRHRLVLFRRVLARLVLRFGPPDTIVLEAVRSLALGKTKKREHIQRIHDNREERTGIREELRKDGFSSSNTSILRYRLFKEAKGRCPFCLCPFCLQEVIFKEAEIEHIVPRSRIDSNEFFNLTVAHRDCNQRKGERTPWEAFAKAPEWESIRQNAENCFGLGSLKYRLFTNPDAENLVERKADIQHTAYIARVIRHVSLIQLGWLGEDGRDPTGLRDPQRTAWRFQVTNGQLTSRLRRAWGLNQILHPLPPGACWDDLSEAEQQQFAEKNRGDLRHHAIDAMVIACTLPWLAHRTHGATDEFGNHGWWTQDEKQRSKAANPIFPSEGKMHDRVKDEIQTVVVRHHVSRSHHAKKLDSTLLSKRTLKVEGKQREVFVARKPLRSKSPDALSDVYSDHLRSFLKQAWKDWSAANPEWDKENKGIDKGKLPETFIEQLRDPIWNTPIADVKFVVEKSASSVFKVGEHPSGSRREVFVAYGENQEVRLYTKKTGDGYVAVPVRPCYPKGNHPRIPSDAGKHAFTLRRGDLFRLSAGLQIGSKVLPPGIYRVLMLPGEADARIRFLPHYQNATPEKGVRTDPLRMDVTKLAGFIEPLKALHELPHPPFAQSQSPGPAEA